MTVETRADGAAAGQEVPAEIARLVNRMRGGDVRALARAVSLVEADGLEARSILSACFPYVGSALRVGLTGPPGAGKSTLVDQMARLYRERSETVGIVAVDPTSPFTGGAILGDRIRMQSHHADRGIYLRSMATRGFLGGLARTTADVASVIEASGKDRILIETVGVGQDEVEIVRLADVTVVVLVPGMGDDVQSIKAGILEIADIYVINKSDREGADRVERELKALQSLALTPAGSMEGEWMMPIVRTIASSGEGVVELAAAIGRCEQWLRSSGHLKQRRQASWRERLVSMFRQEIMMRMAEHGLGEAELSQYAAAIAEGNTDPYRLIPQLIQDAGAPG